VIEITNEAYTRLVQKAIDKENFVFRFGLTGGGCGGMEYVFDYCTETYPTDLELDWGRIKIRVDTNSAPYLTGVIIDYKVEGLNEGFTYINSKEQYRCGCGVSVGFG